MMYFVWIKAVSIWLQSYTRPGSRVTWHSRLNGFKSFYSCGCATESCVVL